MHRQFLWGKLVLGLVAIVAVLQVVHLVLLSRLEARHRKHSGRGAPSASDGDDEYPTYNAVASVTPGGISSFSGGPEFAVSPYQETSAADSRVWVDSELPILARALVTGRVLDASGEFQVVPKLAKAESFPQASVATPAHDISVATHCSVEHLHRLLPFVERWQGPISVAVFAGETELGTALNSIASLRACSPPIRRLASFHLVSPLLPGGRPPLALLGTTAPSRCGSLLEQLREFGRDKTKKNYARGTGVGGVHSPPYPNNLLRNVARRGVSTEFVLTVDIDMLPSRNLRADFTNFAMKNRLYDDSQKEDKTVYVLPAFEANEGAPIPGDKAELLALSDTFRLRPFYFELCWKCQVHTDYETWQKEPPSAGLAPLFEVLWKDPWEPFYISRNTAPFYDERFKQYGFNRISQVCELHIAGYKFSVLNNAFLVHQGLKTPDSFHPEKDADQERNRLLFRQFKSELREKYPESSRRCY
ncbi:beta-1,4-glucuronyltransferase 1-like [Ischnura elegans]|uniref:beta-1,4-glucuronyltransferase 1-like n=1 Tax=Ischnura elegans TaxID=197161 RepID=UPI001ED87B45|nr:beta-1,4-glucuronyltransferase 1-like [Ischnura elegans]